MATYVLVILLMALIILANWRPKIKNEVVVSYSILFITLVFHDGLRWDMATDWESYLTYFESCLYKDNDGFEVGYKWLNILTRTFTEQYTIFLIVHAIIFYSLVFCTIRRYSIDPFISILVLYSITLPFLGMNRQFLALALCLYAIRFILQRQLFLFSITIVLASLFHISAFVFFPVFWLNREIKSKVIFTFLLAAFLVSASGLVNKLQSVLFLGSFQYKLDLYIGGDNTNPILYVVLGGAKKIVWLVLAIYAKQKIFNNYKPFNLFVNCYFIGCIFYVIFNNSIFQMFVGRLLLYFNIFEVFLIPCAFKLFRNQLGKRIALMVLILYSIININKSFDGYVDLVGYDIFRPYKSVFL